MHHSTLRSRRRYRGPHGDLTRADRKSADGILASHPERRSAGSPEVVPLGLVRRESAPSVIGDRGMCWRHARLPYTRDRRDRTGPFPARCVTSETRLAGRTTLSTVSSAARPRVDFERQG